MPIGKPLQIIDFKKQCGSCGLWKELEQFSKRGEGWQFWCKGCTKIYREENKALISANNKEYYQEQKEVLLEKAKVYREENKEVISEKGKVYYEENKELKTVYNKSYYEQNKEVFAEKNKEYKQANQEKLNALNSKRRAKNKGLKTLPSDRKLEESFRRFAKMLTAQTGIKHHLDHISPIQVKGREVPENQCCICKGEPSCDCQKICTLDSVHNLQILVASQNSRKKNKFVPYVESERGYDPNFMGLEFDTWYQLFYAT